MNFTLLAMFSAVAVMLYGRGMVWLAGIIEVGAVGIAFFAVITGRKRRQGKYIVAVDE